MIMAANPQPSGSTWGIHLQGGEDPKAPQTPSETLGGDLRGAGGRGKGGRPIPPACTEDPHGRPALSCACHGQCPALAPHTPWATPAPSCNLASRTHCSFSSMLAQQFLPHLLAVSSNTWRPQTYTGRLILSQNQPPHTKSHCLTPPWGVWHSSCLSRHLNPGFHPAPSTLCQDPGAGEPVPLNHTTSLGEAPTS